MADNYLLRVTAGPSYDPSTHQTVLVNQPTPTKITNTLCTASISVRIQNYRGLPRGSPTTTPYFHHPLHLHDQYSISFHLTPHRILRGPSLVFGNDFDHPIRDRLPPGFQTAFRIVKWAIDPGLEGDVYADRPWLYGRALSSWNVVRVGGKDGQVKGGDEGVLEEGGDGDGVEWRKERGVPEGAEARRKHFLGEGRAEGWEWEEGRTYGADFYNPYLDFNQFALKLPGFSLSFLSYLGGEDYLRYVLKDQDSGEVLFVVVFTLLKKEQVQREEAEAERAGQSVQQQDGAKQEGTKDFEPKADDLD
ncbi:hypothetical protein ACLMJK_006113 [Lecanora helva]